MKIVVLVKAVPDTYRDRRLDLETGLADRAPSETVLDEIGERSLEVALRHADLNPETEVVVVSMGPEGSTAAIRKALTMGASSAVQIIDDHLIGADLGLTADVLAAAVRRIGFDLVIAGNLSTDGAGGVLPAMLAELLDVPAATYLESLEIAHGTVTGARASDGATMRVSAQLPAVISVTERVPDARFPTMKGIMAAKRKPFDIWSVAELGVDPNPAAARSIMIGIAEKPPRSAGVKILDDGDAGTRLAEFLVKSRLV